MRSASAILSSLLAFGLAWGGQVAHGQDTDTAAPVLPQAEASPPSAPAKRPVTEPTLEEKSIAAIAGLKVSILAIKTEIDALRTKLNQATTAAEQEQIAADIQVKVSEQKAQENNLEKVATGVDPQAYLKNGADETDLATEFEDFLRPILSVGKELTAKPRQIEALRTNVANHKHQIELAQKAITNLDNLLAASGSADEAVVIDLRNLRKKWAEKLEQAKNDLGVAEYQLEDAQKSRSSMFASAGKAMASFWRTRGRNFLTAVLAFAGVWFLLRLLYRFLIRYSPLHGNKDRSIYVRILDVAFQVFAVIVALFTAMVVLYSASDWVLLGLMLIVLAGLAWTSKQALPFFFEQAKLMLNLGSVRERERIVIDGIPWEVKRINVYSDLENPALTGGNLRLPIRDLVPLHSRPFESKEAWFPTNEGDWVMLSDETFGRVIQQTPEWVRLVQLGGARKTYATTDFIALSPVDLSQNFRVRVTFGIDYEHQPICTTEVPGIFRERIKEGITALVDEEEIKNIAVEFSQAGASSLDYDILADFAGTAASKHNKLNRLISKICVDVCNEQGWVIPFTQITLHQAPTKAE
jgi:predicted  nucleic acid-binding Zn-ribbon protein